jgi:Ca2+-binding RTX toxin-like protein
VTLKRLVAVALLAASTFAVQPATAGAAVTCTYDAGSRTVSLHLDGTITVFERDGKALLAAGSPCAGATVGNTDMVDVDGAGELALQETTARFGDIRFRLDLTAPSYLDVFRGDTNDTVTVGTGGVSLNRDDTVDVAVVGAWPRVYVSTAAGRDRLSAQGGRGTGGPTDQPVDFRVIGGGDVLRGGGGPDLLLRMFPRASDPPDRVYGYGGDDLLTLGWTDTDAVISGGPGVDTLGAAWTVPAIISLDGVANDGVAGAHNNVMADVENLIGGTAADTFIGNGSANQFKSGGGDDTLVGEGGEDRLKAGNGNDEIDVADGQLDHVWAGNGSDHVVLDCGLDVVNDAEATSCAS